MAKVEIFVTAHKPTSYIKDGIFKPIQVGVGLGRKKIDGFLYDDLGDNISTKNPRYCELTAQYWVWKNRLESDYVGFFHYRRYLAFNNKTKRVSDVWGNIVEDHFSDSIIEKYGLTENEINAAIGDADIVLPEKKDIRQMPNMGSNNREQFLGSGYLHIEDLNIMLDVIKEKHPDFAKYAYQYLDDHYTYLNNMYVMKKNIFSKYCEWLFDILDECDKRIDYTNYSNEAIRTVGHLAERLLNIYILYLQDNNNYKIKELSTVYFMKTDPKEEIKPAFSKNNIPITLAANDFYSPYLATTITSIVKNASSENNYDIIVMQRDISDDNKRRLQNIVSDKKNCSLRFVDISAYSDRFSKLFTHMHFTIETWFRLVMPEILSAYDKVIYLDSDLVVDTDIADLYKTELSDNLLAATKDADTAGLYNGYDPERKEYMDNILKIKNPYEYFQAGVIVFNLKQFRKELSVSDTLKYASSYEWKLLDQDVLNNLAQGKVKFIDMSWNVMTDWAGVRVKDIISRAPKELNDAYAEARKAPKIIHYAGGDKPWQKPDMDLSEYFWKYAKDSGYHEIILSRMIPKKGKSIKEKIKDSSKKILPAGTKRGEFVRKIIARNK